MTLVSTPAAPLRPLEERIVLHLGSGRKYQSDAVNVDIVATAGADVVHDLDQTPWPLDSDRFQEVWAYDVLEHLDDLVKTMEEIYRVCMPGAVVKITAPHYSCSNAFTDLTHRHYFSRFSLDYFTGDNEFAFYTESRFRRRAASIIFYPSLVNKVVWRLANRFPNTYERRWAWMFPAWFLYFELEVVK